MFATHRSDDDVIESARKSLAWHARLRPYLAACLTAALAGHLWLSWQLVRVLVELAENAGDQGNWHVAGFLIGLVPGIGLGATAFGLIHQLANAVREPRELRLLVQLHDATRREASVASEPNAHAD